MVFVKAARAESGSLVKRSEGCASMEGVGQVLQGSSSSQRREKSLKVTGKAYLKNVEYHPHLEQCARIAA